jgi:lipid-A-disaccharide synthase
LTGPISTCHFRIGSNDGQKVIYYISPSRAWRTYRVKAIKRNVDRMIVTPFERDFYQRAGVNVDYVGHPLVDTAGNGNAGRICSRHGFDTSRPIVGLLPGSRRSIMKFILPVVFEAVTLREDTSDLQFVVSHRPQLVSGRAVGGNWRPE